MTKKNAQLNVFILKNLFIYAEYTIFAVNMEKSVVELLDKLPPISLEEMESIRLMNRLDQKYLATVEQLVELLQMAQGNYMVQQIDGERVSGYRTLYLDTPDNQMYFMHHNRRAPRQKIRVRTYLQSDITFLEVKNKNNHGRTKKKRMQVNSPATLLADGGNSLLEQCAWFRLEELVPKMENQFERITLVNLAKTERLTIDCHIRFHHEETGLDNTFDQLVVIELKRDGNVDSPVLDIMRKLRIRPSGFSKYCIGTVVTNPDIKQNNFLKKIRKIQKMLGEEVTGQAVPYRLTAN